VGGDGANSQGSSAAISGKSIKVWTLENLPDRIKVTQAIVDRFSKETGVEVELVGIDEDQFNQLVTSAAAAGDLPDVVGALSLAGVWSMAANDLLDSEAAAGVIDDLGEDTFSERALELSSRDGDRLAVPSDGWAQLLLYRKDWFAQAGLQPPDTYEALAKAASTLNKAGVAGIVAANVANDSFTQQTFEHLALANGCELVEGGEVTLDSASCVEAFEEYAALMRSSVRGAQDVDSTRATYFAGKAAMVIWSSFILDELAGLREDAKPSCPECRQDPAYLAKDTGVVTALKGPGGEEPAQYGEIVSWAITAESETAAAQAFVGYLMEEGYEDWLGFAPEGKIPVRRGTKGDATKFTDLWDSLQAGVDTKAPLSKFYPPDVLEALSTSPDTFSRWGLTQGEGELVGSTLGELPVPQAISALASGEVDAAGAARQADTAVQALKDDLG
jgi:multiple sugar transport system substrate-binding protein